MTNTLNNTGLTAREYARIQKLTEKHADAIRTCSVELATNFNRPAQRIIGYACADMGISRLDWEKITAVQNNWEYEKPSASMLARWASY